MNRNSENDIDEELARSIERLVEEENNVARAFVEGQAMKKASSGNEEAAVSSKGYTAQNSDLGATQMFDKREVAHQLEIEKEEQEPLADDVVALSEKQKEFNEPKQPQKLNRKNKLIIAGACGLVAAVIVVIAAAAVIMNNNRKKSYDYNFSKGMEQYNAQNFEAAEAYLKSAYGTNEGKKNTELMYALYTCYMNNKDEKSAVDILSELLSYDKYNEKAITSLASYYYDKKDGAALTELIKKYRGTNGEKFLTNYEISVPTTSEKEGSYTGSLKLKLIAEDGCRIYYTTDGTEPTIRSTEFKDEVELETGTVTLKAIAVNEMGVCSDIAEYKYVIDYKQPDAPKFSPEAGEYEAGQKITIENIPEGAKAYYTLDGTTPTSATTLYTEPFALEKSAVVSAVIISEHEISSPITRESFIIKEAKEYSFDEAVTLLKNRMKALNILKSDGETTADGAKATFVYQSRQTIRDIEMYYIRYDVKRNGITSAEGYYGVGVRNGQCYKVTGSSGQYSAVQY